MRFTSVARAAMARHLQTSASFLRNTLREPWVTCSICAAPVDSTYTRCYPCNEHRKGQYADELADQVASIVYAIDGRTSGQVMYGYKRVDASGQPWPQPDHEAIIVRLLALAEDMHRDCVGRLLHQPVTHRVVIPSTKRQDRCPLGRLVQGDDRVIDHPLAAARLSAQSIRTIDSALFATAPLPPGAHVQVLDDTWTTGAHAQSAAVTLRRAGAAHVSILTVARWLKPAFPATTAFLRDRYPALPPFDAGMCPWTGATCPS
jgi:hypothetical protein